MSAQNQLFLKLFLLYTVLFGGMVFLFHAIIGSAFDLKSIPLFLLVAAYLSFRRSRKMSE